MFQEEYQQPPAAATYRLTYSPAHYPNGVPRDPHASRQVLAERRSADVVAPTADAATWSYERDHRVMVTACERVQDEVTS